jgi:hypothetical protein
LQNPRDLENRGDADAVVGCPRTCGYRVVVRGEQECVVAFGFTQRRDDVGGHTAGTAIIANPSGLQLGAISQRVQVFDDQIADARIGRAADGMRMVIAHQFPKNTQGSGCGKCSGSSIGSPRDDWAVRQQRRCQQHPSPSQGQHQPAILGEGHDERNIRGSARLS